MEYYNFKSSFYLQGVVLYIYCSLINFLLLWLQSFEVSKWVARKNASRRQMCVSPARVGGSYVALQDANEAEKKCIYFVRDIIRTRIYNINTYDT